MTGKRTPPPTPKTDLSRVTTGNAVQERLRTLYGSFQDWKRVGAEMGVTGGMAYRVAMTNYEPQDNAIRGRLGLSKLERVAVCARCGVVHVRKTCPPAKPSAPRVRRPSRRKLALDVLRIIYGKTYHG